MREEYLGLVDEVGALSIQDSTMNHTSSIDELKANQELRTRQMEENLTVNLVNALDDFSQFNASPNQSLPPETMITPQDTASSSLSNVTQDNTLHKILETLCTKIDSMQTSTPSSTNSQGNKNTIVNPRNGNLGVVIAGLVDVVTIGDVIILTGNLVITMMLPSNME